MNAPPILTVGTCNHCGARSQNKDGKCWLCYEDPSSSNPYAAPNVTVEQGNTLSQSSKSDNVFNAILGVCILLTVLVGIGIAVQDPGLLIPYAMVLGPAYAITLLRGSIQYGKSSTHNPANLLLTFAVSLLATVLVSIVLVVGAAIVFFLICLQIAGGIR